MNDYNKEQIKNIQRETIERDYDESIGIPITRNFLGSLGLTISLIAIITYTMYLFNVAIVLSNDSELIEQVFKIFTNVIIVATVMVGYKIVKSTFTKQPETYGDIVFGISVAALIQILFFVKVVFTTTYLLYVGAAITIGIVVFGTLLFIKFSSDESLIVRTIFKLGAKSMEPALLAITTERDRLRQDLLSIHMAVEGHSDEAVDTILSNGSEASNRRAMLYQDAMQYYTLISENKSVAYRDIATKYGWKNAQKRAKQAYEILLKVRAIDNSKRIINPDRSGIELAVAKEVSKIVEKF